MVETLPNIYVNKGKQWRFGITKTRVLISEADVNECSELFRVIRAAQVTYRQTVSSSFLNKIWAQIVNQISLET